jgi:hypothetical protein
MDGVVDSVPKDNDFVVLVLFQLASKGVEEVKYSPNVISFHE